MHSSFIRISREDPAFNQPPEFLLDGTLTLLGDDNTIGIQRHLQVMSMEPNCLLHRKQRLELALLQKRRGGHGGMHLRRIRLRG
jgi:hypothetical protein